MNDTEYVLPTVALRGVTVLPGMVVHFDVNREKSIHAIEEAMAEDNRLFLVTQRKLEVAEPTLDDLYRIGTVSEIRKIARLPRDMIQVTVEGIDRAELLDFESTDKFLRSRISVFADDSTQAIDDDRREAMIRNLKELVSIYSAGGRNLSRELLIRILDIDQLEKLVDQISINLPVPSEKQQRLLNAIGLQERYDVLCETLAREASVERIRYELQEKVKQRLDKNQREYVLREQLKEIREELGDDNTQTEIAKFKRQCEELKAPK